MSACDWLIQAAHAVLFAAILVMGWRTWQNGRKIKVIEVLLASRLQEFNGLTARLTAVEAVRVEVQPPPREPS